MSSIYIYCISERTGSIAFSGINGLPVDNVPIDELCLVCSHISDKVKSVEENYHAHEKVLEELMGRNTAILPFRFATYIDEQDGIKTVKDKYGILCENINHIKGKDEISVRAVWNLNNVLGKAEERHNTPEIKIPNEKVRSYLNEKMEEYKKKTYIERYAASEADRIHKYVSNDVFEGKYTLLKTESMFFNAAYLIEKNQIPTFSARIHSAISEFSEYKFLVTGPWPPYNFCNLTL